MVVLCNTVHFQFIPTDILNCICTFHNTALSNALMYKLQDNFLEYYLISHSGLQSRSVGGGSAPRPPAQVSVTTNKEMREKRRQISAIKTIMLTSGSFFMTLFPMSA